jgi:serine/threonine protein kinase
MNSHITKEEIRSLLVSVDQSLQTGMDILSALDALADHPFPELIGLAHLTLCTRDRRHLCRAIRRFTQADCVNRISEARSIAIRFGDVRSIVELKSLGYAASFDLKSWLCDFALPRFDCYRDEDAGTMYIREEDATLLSALLNRFSLSWREAIDRARRSCKGIPEYRYDLLEKLANGEAPLVEAPCGDRNAKQRFIEHAEKYGITILREIHSDRSNVFLAIDQDGIAKIFKERNEWEHDAYGRSDDTEDELNQALQGAQGIAPYYGAVDVGDGILYLRFGVGYGTPLVTFLTSDTHTRPCDRDIYAIGDRIARALENIHDRHIAHLDLRPENILIEGRVACLIDFGDSRSIPDKDGFVSTHLLDAFYTAPEVVLKAEGGCATDIFQLGILLHQLLTGTHPFTEGLLEGIENQQVSDLGHGLANTLLPLESSLEKRNDEKSRVVLRMLNKHSQQRPSAKEIADAFREERDYFVTAPKRPETRSNLGTVIFPARMGVPHRGHIDFMSRLLDLGYSLIVSMQHSYFHDENDPIPKWLVLKMVAKSLMRRGHDLSKVKFICTPMFMEDMRLRLHFGMMPDSESISAVATGNLDVVQLFSGLRALDQRVVFGKEGEAFKTRSWGAMLRQAIRSNDMTAYRDLIAEGAEDILSFEEIRAYCLNPPIPLYVWENGSVCVSIRCDDLELGTNRVRTYETPEDAVARSLGSMQWIDRFSRESVLRHEGRLMRLVFDGVDLDMRQRQCIHYSLH